MFNEHELSVISQLHPMAQVAAVVVTGLLIGGVIYVAYRIIK